MDNLTQQIADYAAGLSYQEIPEGVVHRATQLVIDSLACAIGAYGCEPASIGRRVAHKGEMPGWNRGRILGYNENIPCVEEPQWATRSASRNPGRVNHRLGSG